jgi:hypothetical protein
VFRPLSHKPWTGLIWFLPMVGSCEHINDAFGRVGSGGYSYWWMAIFIGGWW